MRSWPALALLLLGLASASAGAQDIMSYEEYQRLDHPEPYVLSLCAASGDGAVLYFGSRHSNDPEDAQMGRIEAAFDAFEPDLVLTEGGDLDLDSLSRAGAVRRFGEFGLARWLAARQGVPAENLDPPREAEITHLRDENGFGVAELKVFYTLRQVSQSHRSDARIDFTRAVPRYLHYLSSEGLSGPPETLKQFQADVGRLLPDVADWRAVSSQLFYPGPQSPHHFTNDIQTASNDFRDRYHARHILELVDSGRRVFAIVGSTHVVMQEPVLRSRLRDGRDGCPHSDGTSTTRPPTAGALESGGDSTVRALPAPGETSRDTAGFDGEAAWRRARAAFMSHDFGAASAAYRSLVRAPGEQPRRMPALTALAAITWRVLGDTAEAARILDAGIRAAPGRRDPVEERARLRLARGMAASAATDARRAMSLSTSPADSAESEVLLVECLLEPAVRPLDPADAEGARKALDIAGRLVDEQPGALDPARALAVAGVLAGDGPAILAAVRSYYLIGTGLAAPRAFEDARRSLPRWLGTWRGGRLALSDQIRAVHALADLRLFVPAALLARRASAEGESPADRDARSREIVAYARFKERLKSGIDRLYARIARGDTVSVEDIGAALRARAAALWPSLVWEDARPPVTDTAIAEVLGRKFGAMYTLGLTSGYPSLHMGHVVVDERRTVLQGGQQAVVRFVSLDAMVSNGFETWAWDGAASTGGWSTAERIVQVRPSYAWGPLSAWRLATDSASVARLASRVAADSARDVEVARRNPVAYLPSVEARLLRDARAAILDSLRNAGLTAHDLEAAFKREYARGELESSIFAHEGRHAIDQKSRPELDSEELEFRAKVAQVVYAPWPRLGAVSGIFQPNIGDGSPHGQANLRIMKGLLAWLKGHSAGLPRLDRARPLLPQLPRLSADELRSAFASMEPRDRAATVPRYASTFLRAEGPRPASVSGRSGARLVTPRGG